jgi:hypothetical protein
MTPQASTAPVAVQVPRTEAELRAVTLQREELRSQLRTVSSSIERMTVEREVAQSSNDQVAVRELSSRLTDMRARSARIERDLLQADDAVSQALARGVGSQEQGVPAPDVSLLPEVPYPGFPSSDFVATAILEARQEMRAEYERMAIVGGAGLILLGALLWRWAWRRGVARLRRELAVESPTAGGQRELRDAVDAIALEVERISENQRFVTKLLGEKLPASAQRDDASPR